MIETAADLVPLIRTGNFATLRDELSGLRPPEIAAALTDLRPDDQVIAFRILPRRLAAAVFEYMRRDAQRALIKAMGQEDVDHLLNHVSPDDRTMFLSELPANVTRQLLSLLTPEERSEAVARSGDVICAVRRDAGRCHWPHDLLHRRPARAARHAVVTTVRRTWRRHHAEELSADVTEDAPHAYIVTRVPTDQRFRTCPAKSLDGADRLSSQRCQSSESFPTLERWIGVSPLSGQR